MNVSYQWLKSLVPFDLGPEELAEKLTFAGLSVEQVTYFNKGIKNVIVGEVIEVAPHPDKKKLSVCRVNTGKEELTIVCGAPNVRPGIKAPLALVGAELPGGITIGIADKGGIASYGMLCSDRGLALPQGLALADSEGGIFILPEECTVGEDIVTALCLDDAVLEFELTPNRADCLSVINIAREVAAITGAGLHLPEIVLPPAVKDIRDMMSIAVLDDFLCPRFTGKVIEGVKIGPSPFWLRQRLAAAGIRSINNVVDISNYVLMEMSQPSHTFDYERLAGHKIIVRRAAAGEKLVTLDEVERTLTDDMLLVCDGERAVSVAGVMGGMDTEITVETNTIFIECAYFYPKSIRLTSRALGLSSESSARFEKGIDKENVVRASDRIAQLICELADGTLIEGTLDTLEGEIPKRQVVVTLGKINGTLGIALSWQEVEAVMSALAFAYSREGDKIIVDVPSYRQDITRDVDLIEEIARLYGYDKIPATLPMGKMTEGRRTPKQKTEDQIKDRMAAMGFSEIITYSFTNKKYLDDLLLPAEDVRRRTVVVKNPFSDEQGVMRTTLLPSLLTVAARNMNRRNLDIAIYEMAHVFLPGEEKLPNETPHLAALVAGVYSAGWSGEKKNFDFFYLKGVLEEALGALHIANWTMGAEDLPPFLHPGRSANLYIGGEYLGYLGELHPLVAENFELPERANVLEIDLELLLSHASKHMEYHAVSKYPGVEVDLAFLAHEEDRAGEIAASIKKSCGELLQQVELFDIYQGGQIETGQKSLAYKLKFQAKERTLTADEINAMVEKIRESLKEEYGILLRS